MTQAMQQVRRLDRRRRRRAGDAPAFVGRDAFRERRQMIAAAFDLAGAAQATAARR
jgi:hypothetical protein